MPQAEGFRAAKAISRVEDGGLIGFNRGEWGRALYPDSSLVSPDGRLLCIGMRQFVGVFDRTGRRLEWLIPSGEFLNRLSDADEARVRQQHRP